MIENNSIEKLVAKKGDVPKRRKTRNKRMRPDGQEKDKKSVTMNRGGVRLDLKGQLGRKSEGQKNRKWVNSQEKGQMKPSKAGTGSLRDIVKSRRYPNNPIHILP